MNVITIRILSSLARRPPSAICTFGVLRVRSGVFCYQSKELSVAMSTSIRARSPTFDPEVPAPLEKKIRLEEDTMDISNGAIEKTNDSALGAPGPSKTTSKKSKKKKQKHVLPEPYSPGDVLWRDIVALLGNDTIEHAQQHGTEWESPFGHLDEVEVEVSQLSSNGAHKDIPLLFVDTDKVSINFRRCIGTFPCFPSSLGDRRTICIARRNNPGSDLSQLASTFIRRPCRNRYSKLRPARR